MTGISRRKQRDINDAIRHLWCAVDQAEIMDLAEYAFTHCPYRTKMEILERLYDYAADGGSKSGAMPNDELDEWLQKSEQILRGDRT